MKIRTKMAKTYTKGGRGKNSAETDNIYSVKMLSGKKLVLKLTSSPEQNWSKAFKRKNENAQSIYPKVDRRNLHRGCKRIFNWNYQYDWKIYRESKVVLVDIYKHGRINSESRTNGSFQSACNFADCAVLGNGTKTINHVPSWWNDCSNHSRKSQTYQSDQDSFGNDGIKTSNDHREIERHDTSIRFKVQDTMTKKVSSLPAQDSGKVTHCARNPEGERVPNSFKCSLCIKTKSFSSMSELSKHAQLIHCNPLGKTVTKIAFNCLSCSQKFSNYNQGIEHRKLCKIGQVQSTAS